SGRRGRPFGQNRWFIWPRGGRQDGGNEEKRSAGRPQGPGGRPSAEPAAQGYLGPAVPPWPFHVPVAELGRCSGKYQAEDGGRDGGPADIGSRAGHLEDGPVPQVQ